MRPRMVIRADEHLLASRHVFSRCLLLAAVSEERYSTYSQFMLMPYSRNSARRSLSVSQNTVTITLPADFTIFSSWAIVAQGGSTVATRSCSQGPSEEPVSRPGAKIE